MFLIYTCYVYHKDKDLWFEITMYHAQVHSFLCPSNIAHGLIFKHLYKCILFVDMLFVFPRHSFHCLFVFFGGRGGGLDVPLVNLIQLQLIMPM